MRAELTTGAGSPVHIPAMTTRLLLSAGTEDEYKNVNNYSMTRELANPVVNTPGGTLFLEKAGHSIHAECPAFFARQIVRFLVDGDGA
jgi:pimeloyl-ACP methyl ester carboxylesterase